MYETIADITITLSLQTNTDINAVQEPNKCKVTDNSHNEYIHLGMVS